jgi:choline dehydrogenase-like flavoprotein
MPQQIFDVIIVGSGPGGGVATFVLTRAGLRVALVEAGRQLTPGIDYNDHAMPYELHEMRADPARRSKIPGFPYERNHFTPVGDNPGHLMLKAVGGRSLCWASHSLRFGPLDFKRWEIGYNDVAPYYSKVEKFAGIHGFKDGLWNMPDGEFQKGVPMRCGEAKLKIGTAKLKAMGREIDFVPLRKAILTEPHWSGRALCHYCGGCMKGCCVDAKYTSANTPIPAALKTGKLTIFKEAMMTRIETDSRKRKITGIYVIDKDGKEVFIAGKTLVLACGSIETPRHLLINNLANSSGMVGKNLVSHHGVWVQGFFPDLASREGVNEDGTDWFHSLVTGMYWKTPSKNFDLSYQVQCGSGLRHQKLAITELPGFGSALKQKLREKNQGYVGMNMQGTLISSPNKFVALDPQRKDKFGLPLPLIQLKYEDSDLAQVNDCVATCEEMIRQSGGEVIASPGTNVTAEQIKVDAVHWVSTTRMGKNPKTSVVNNWGQSHDIPNLFIGDASVFTAYPEKNPTLTNMALSWRMSEGLVERFKRGEFSK